MPRPTTDTRQLDLFYAFVGDVPLRDERENMTLPQKRTLQRLI